MPRAIPVIYGTIKGAVFALGFSSATAAAVASFSMKAAAYWGVSKLSSALTKQKGQGAPERIASQLNLSLGEQPRELVFGRTAIGGSLMSAGNWGGEHGTDWECLVICLADHPLDALEGFWVWDQYYSFSGNGAQTAFGGGLTVHLQNATPTGAAPPEGYLGHGLVAADVAAGVTRLFVAYSAKLVEERGSRPNFRWVVRGKRFYDPRKDSTVPGGSGAHRWTNPATWEWTENPALIRYNWLRGIFGGDDVTDLAKLWLGRGLSAFEAPPARVFAAANLCDEAVARKAGGTEARYTIGGVIRADQPFDQVEGQFALATAGTIVNREGGTELEPGAAKATAFEITDGDLLRGGRVVFEDLLTESERRNTVVTRYMEPGQRWSLHAAPVRRLLADITADGGPAEDPLELEWVNRNTQAQRVGQVRYRQNRRERRAAIMLPARFAAAEEGDWIGWTSDRYHGGGRVVYRVERWSRGPDWPSAGAARGVGGRLRMVGRQRRDRARGGAAAGAGAAGSADAAGADLHAREHQGRGRRARGLARAGGSGGSRIGPDADRPRHPGGAAGDPAAGPGGHHPRVHLGRAGRGNHRHGGGGGWPAAGSAPAPYRPAPSSGPARAVGAAGAQRPRRPGGGRLGRDHPGSDPGRRTGPHRQCHRPAAEGMEAVIIRRGPSAEGPWVLVSDGASGDGRYTASAGLQPGETYWLQISYRAEGGQVVSEPLVMGPYEAQSLVAASAVGVPVDVAELLQEHTDAIAQLEEDYATVGDLSAALAEAADHAADAATAAAAAILAQADAEDAATAAASSATTATTKAAEASSSASSAASSATTAAGAASTATTQAGLATTASTNAGNSATAAAGSASSASSSATAAGNSATAANSAKVSAESARDTAAGSATAAASSASSATTSATAAGTSATAAQTAKTEAETARSAAQAAESAAVSAKNSAESASSTATTQAGLAATAATNAGNSATAAAGSASSASSSATTAGNSATAATAAKVWPRVLVMMRRARRLRRPRRPRPPAPRPAAPRPVLRRRRDLPPQPALKRGSPQPSPVRRRPAPATPRTLPTMRSAPASRLPRHPPRLWATPPGVKSGDQRHGLGPVRVQQRHHRGAVVRLGPDERQRHVRGLAVNQPGQLVNARVRRKLSKVSGQLPGTNGWRHTTAGTGDFGGTQTTLNASPGGDWLVVEADVVANGTVGAGSGVFLTVRNTGGTALVSRSVVFGALTSGRTYRFRELVDARNASADRYQIYAMTRYSGFSPSGGADLTWLRLGMRRASSEEVRAGTVIPTWSPRSPRSTVRSPRWTAPRPAFRQSMRFRPR